MKQALQHIGDTREIWPYYVGHTLPRHQQGRECDKTLRSMDAIRKLQPWTSGFRVTLAYRQSQSGASASSSSGPVVLAIDDGLQPDGLQPESTPRGRVLEPKPNKRPSPPLVAPPLPHDPGPDFGAANTVGDLDDSGLQPDTDPLANSSASARIELLERLVGQLNRLYRDATRDDEPLDAVSDVAVAFAKEHGLGTNPLGYDEFGNYPSVLIVINYARPNTCQQVSTSRIMPQQVATRPNKCQQVSTSRSMSQHVATSRNKSQQVATSPNKSQQVATSPNK